MKKVDTNIWAGTKFMKVFHSIIATNNVLALLGAGDSDEAISKLDLLIKFNFIGRSVTGRILPRDIGDISLTLPAFEIHLNLRDETLEYISKGDNSTGKCEKVAPDTVCIFATTPKEKNSLSKKKEFEIPLNSELSEVLRDSIIQFGNSGANRTGRSFYYQLHQLFLYDNEKFVALLNKFLKESVFNYVLTKLMDKVAVTLKNAPSYYVGRIFEETILVNKSLSSLIPLEFLPTNYWSVTLTSILRALCNPSFFEEKELSKALIHEFEVFVKLAMLRLQLSCDDLWKFVGPILEREERSADFEEDLANISEIVGGRTATYPYRFIDEYFEVEANKFLQKLRDEL